MSAQNISSLGSTQVLPVKAELAREPQPEIRELVQELAQQLYSLRQINESLQNRVGVLTEQTMTQAARIEALNARDALRQEQNDDLAARMDQEKAARQQSEIDSQHTIQTLQTEVNVLSAKDRARRLYREINGLAIQLEFIESKIDGSKVLKGTASSASGALIGSAFGPAGILAGLCVGLLTIPDKVSISDGVLAKRDQIAARLRQKEQELELLVEEYPNCLK